MNGSVMISVEIEVEVVFDEKTKEARTAVIQTADIPHEAHGWIKAAAIEQFERAMAR